MHETIAQLIAFNATLLPEMVELKFDAMQENLFRFFRGTAHLFYADWANVSDQFPSPLAWICGDLHLENFGTYKASNRQVYFDLDDFDEALLAPATWEIVRTVCSIFIAFDALKISQERARRMAEQYLKSYSETLRTGKTRYIEARTASGILADFLTSVASRKNRELLLKKTKRGSKHPVFRLPHPKHRELPKEVRKELKEELREWIRTNDDGPYNFEVVDIVFRVAGTGSMGLKRYAILLKSRLKDEKYVLLDMKQVRASSVLPWVKHPQPPFASDAERVLTIQRMMQNMSPALLSSIVFKNELYLLQEMQPVEDTINFSLLRNRYRDMFRVIDDMGMLTASAQLRSAGRMGAAGPDELIAFGNETNWHQRMLDYAQSYLQKARSDYEIFSSWHNIAP